MSKPYALSLYSSVLDAAPRFERSLTSAAKGWKRSKRSQGGCWQGSFSIEGTETQLHDWYRRWLGYDVQERAGGFLSWRGMVYEMDLTLNGVTRRRTLDLMYNRVKSTYVTMDIVGLNEIENGGFENFTAGGAGVNDDFWAWAETSAVAGNIKSAGAAHAGASCVLLTGDGTARNTEIRQNITVTPGASHYLKLWVKGDAAPQERINGGRWGIQDAATTQWIGTSTNRGAYAAWKEVVETFVGPASGEVILYLWGPDANGRDAWFDDVEVYERGEGVYETEWATVEDAGLGGPHDRYGVKEQALHMDDYVQATARAYRDSYLAENAWPWPRPVAASRQAEARLDVLVAGYVHTMNWLYVTEGNGSEDNVDVWISAIVGAEFGLDPDHGGEVWIDAGDCQFVKAFDIQTNALQVTQTVPVEERAWDVISELIALGDATGNPWRGWVDLDRGFHYAAISTTPRYYIRRDGIYDTMAGSMPSNPWLMQPAVFRDMTYRPVATEPGSFLDSPQDIYVEEVEMADGWDQPALKTALFYETDILQAQAERGQENAS